MDRASYTVRSPVYLFRPEGMGLGGDYLPIKVVNGAYRREHSIQRMWIALFIAAMCETGDAYRRVSA